MRNDTAHIDREAWRPLARAGAGCVRCPGCGEPGVRRLGDIPAGYVFAGRRMERPMAGGALYECAACALLFRYPRPGAAELAPLYAAGSLSAWSGTERPRRDWAAAAQWLREDLTAGARILDVGCFDGGFFDYLGGDFRRCGIELHPEARAAARRRGVHIIADDLADLGNDAGFDAIVAIDIIEHVHDPGAFLARARAALRPGGCIVVSSGNTDSASWRLLRARYWYCAIPEHISFINPRWCRRAAAATGLRVVREARFAHVSEGWLKKIKQILINGGYWAAPPLWAAVRRRGIGGLDARRWPQLADHPPSWVTAKDHFIVMFRADRR